ncbi:probable ATP-dependent DNA helicase HFM1 [Ostrinia nubilalis]|uniref:probable ATP-dependent DNA helicase HFM1 n=1 Tax=Ostrinia nubilalis TaxID=29057 RepID=UPI0030826237
MTENLANFTDILGDEDEIGDSQQSQPLSLPSSTDSHPQVRNNELNKIIRPAKGTGQFKEFRSVEEIDKSLVVCAPTGSGKTVVFEMAIVQLLMEMENNNSAEDFKIIYNVPVNTNLRDLCHPLMLGTRGGPPPPPPPPPPYAATVFLLYIFSQSIVYFILKVAPVKALCTERLTEWYSKFTRLGLLCIEVTGDTDVDFTQLQAYKIIITTPEKWDMLTRRWKDHRGLVEMIKLFLIDEVHILNDETRGPVLEAVVSRMKTVQIFCNTRKSVLLTAETLSKEITITFSPEQKAKLTALASTIKTKKLQSLVLAGVGCHHAGMLYEERIYIEHAFRNGDLPILITTTTLAMGVNLPAHLVIIKNTQQYVNGAYQEYSISTVLQMVGRAGRPQFDTEATAVIMTRQRDKR